MLKKDIQEDIVRIRDELRRKRKTLSPRPMMTGQEVRDWEEFCSRIQEDDVKWLNKVIDDYNLQVPMLRGQMFHFPFKKEVAKVLESGEARMDTVRTSKDPTKKDEERKSHNLVGALYNRMQKLFVSENNYESKDKS